MSTSDHAWPQTATHFRARRGNTRRLIRVGAATTLVVVAGLAGLGSMWTPAATPSPPFKQCPAVSSDSSCAILIIINPDASLTILQDASQPPFDKAKGAPGAEDTLVGVVNGSGVVVPSIALGSSGLPLFAFDADGLCKFTFSGSGYCAATPKPVTGYEGPDSFFSKISSNKHDGTVNFTDAGGGLAAGASTYFSLEETLTPSSFATGAASSLVGSTGSATSSDFADPATVSATLTSSGAPISGATVAFTVAPGASAVQCHGTTNASGVASCVLTPTMAAGSYPLVASYAGSSVPFIAATTATSTFTVTHEQNSLSYTGPASAVEGRPLTMSGVLTTDDPVAATPLAGRTVRLTLGSGASAQACTAVTGPGGSASCTIPSVLQHTLSVTASAAFAGDGFYVAAASAGLVGIPQAAVPVVPTPNVGAAGPLPLIPAGLLVVAGLGVASWWRRPRHRR